MAQQPEFVKAKDVFEASDMCPWAHVILPCEDGFMCFVDLAQYRDWFNAPWENLQLPNLP